MLGHGYWRRRFGGERAVIGRGITIESRATEIVGVMPEGFRVVDVEPDLIVPFGIDRSRLTLPGFGLQAVARLKPGVDHRGSERRRGAHGADLDDVVARRAIRQPARLRDLADHAGTASARSRTSSATSPTRCGW